MTEQSAPAGHGAPQAVASFGWLELFFDLVVVAAVAVLADGVREDPDWTSVGMLLLLYSAIWMTWISIVLYTNLAQDATRTRPVIITMFLVAVMAGASPLQFPDRANAFAIAFIIARSLVAGSALRTGKVLASWPILQFGGAISPWFVSLWVHPPAKYWIWALAIVVDLTFVAWRGGRDGDEAAADLQARRDGHDERERARDRGQEGGRRRGRDERAKLVAVDVNKTHLDERLGVFVIIVLGEAVSQLVFAAASVEWTRDFKLGIAAAFAILVGLWWLTFSYGFAAAPHTQLANLPPRFGLPMHLVSTAGIVCLAAGMSGLAESPGESPDYILRWLMCGGLAVHFLASGIGGLAAHASWGWILGWSLPSTLVPLLLAIFGAGIPSYALAGCLFATVGWQVLYGLRLREILAL